jgi:hypothetical protein
MRCTGRYASFPLFMEITRDDGYGVIADEQADGQRKEPRSAGTLRRYVRSRDLLTLLACQKRFYFPHNLLSTGSRRTLCVCVHDVCTGLADRTWTDRAHFFSRRLDVVCRIEGNIVVSIGDSHTLGTCVLGNQSSYCKNHAGMAIYKLTISWQPVEMKQQHHPFPCLLPTPTFHSVSSLSTNTPYHSQSCRA